MEFRPTAPYDSLPELPPTQEVRTVRVMDACVRAARALAELKGTGDRIPNQGILINVIPLQEAKLSSEIENIVTTQDELYRGALDESKVKHSATKEVLRYREALRLGYEELRTKPLSLPLVRRACSVLLDTDMPFRPAGKGVVIQNVGTGRITYTPPSGGPQIEAKLENLLEYLLDTEPPDPLIRMAVGHYQFEAIHPFEDGNGRTGRILNILHLLHAGLLDIPVLYLSRFIIGNKPEYYALLRSVTEKGDWESWLLFMLQAVEETANWTTGRVCAIKDLFDQTVERVREEAEGVYTRELVELIFSHPYCKIASLVDAGIAKRQTASTYLRLFEDMGILRGEKRGREMLYRNPELMRILTE